MGKSFHFKTRHIKIELRPPDDKKHLDLNDPYDVQEARKIIFKEWLEIDYEVRKYFEEILKMVIIDGKPYDVPDENKEDSPKFLLP